MAKILEFMGSRTICKSLRRGSIVAIKSENKIVSGAKNGREAKMARGLSYQFQNLSRGDSFTQGQFKKWAKEMSVEDLVLVESVVLKEMKRLGYEPHLIKTEEDCIFFTAELCGQYVAQNEMLTKKMNADLAIDNPADLQRRMVQAAVLENTMSEHYDAKFVKKFSIDVEGALDSIDDVINDKGFLRRTSVEFDFHNWPVNASMVGFQVSSVLSVRLYFVLLVFVRIFFYIPPPIVQYQSA